MTQRFLPALSWPAIEALAKDPGVLVLPIGAIEQHGPHLPVWTDARLAEETVARAFALLPDAVAAWYLPVLSYGKSNEHTGFPGTFALSASTLMAVVRDIGVAAARSGFVRLLFYNAHGGNKALLEIMVRDLRAETGLLCFLAQGQTDAAGLPDAERRFGIHAGTVETALMQHLTPELVGPLPPAQYPDFASERLNLTSLPQVGWLSRDWSPPGHFGDPGAATPADGERWLAQSARRLADLIAEASSFQVAHG